MKNETICKVLCHNIVVAIHAMYEFGIDPEFCSPGSASRRIHLI